MPKSIKFEHQKSSRYPYNRVRITMSTWSWSLPRSKQSRQFTVELSELKRALKDACLFEKVPVPTEDIKLMSEISMYHALSSIDSGAGTKVLSKRGKEARDRLWDRITRSLQI